MNSFKDKLFTAAKEKGFSDCELYYSAANSFSVKIFKGEIDEYKNTDSVGASFRGTFNGRMGYAYTERIDESVIPALISNAAANARVIEEEEIEKLYPGDETYPEVNSFCEALAETSAARKIELALLFEKYAYGIDPRVKSVDLCIVGSEEAEIKIANSYGLDVSHRDNIAFAWIAVRSEENGITKNGSEFWTGRNLDDFDYKTTAKKAADKALSAIGAKSIPTGEYAVIFDGEAARGLFSAFAGIFYAENVQKGFSLLKDKVGQPVASPAVTLRDEGVCDLSIVSVPFDSEGVSCKNKAVIENGVLKTLLYNTKTAAKDGVASTGNGFKPSFRASVQTSVTNFYIVPSGKSPCDLMKEAGDGVLITDLSGLHSGANTVSGDFSLSADGFLIENGTKSRPVEQITVAGNFYEVLKNISAVANDLRFAPPGASGSIGMPSILVKGLRISGL